MTSEEERLVSACIKHDQRACKTLYDRFSSQMFGLCLRYCSSREEAQDVLHDGFIKVFENLSQLTSESTLSAWVRTIMLNTAISAWRSRSLRETASLDNIEEGVQPASCDYDRYDTSVILEAIRRLPDNYRMAFNLHEVEGYSYEEVAERMGTTQVNVRTLYFRAKGRLAKSLADLQNN